MGLIENMLSALSGMEGGTHPWLMQVMHGVSGDQRETGPGLGWLLTRLRESGHGAAVRAWAGGDLRVAIAPHDLHAAIGDAELHRMAQRSRLTEDEFVSKLSQHLPGIVHHLSVDGTPPA